MTPERCSGLGWARGIEGDPGGVPTGMDPPECPWISPLPPPALPQGKVGAERGQSSRRGAKVARQHRSRIPGNGNPNTDPERAGCLLPTQHHIPPCIHEKNTLGLLRDGIREATAPSPPQTPPIVHDCDGRGTGAFPNSGWDPPTDSSSGRAKGIRLWGLGGLE